MLQFYLLAYTAEEIGRVFKAKQPEKHWKRLLFVQKKRFPGDSY